MSQYYLGIDVGSTTVKAYLTDEKDVCLFSRYVRHNSDVRNTILTLLEEIHQEYPGINIYPVITGSGGLVNFSIIKCQICTGSDCVYKKQ